MKKIKLSDLYVLQAYILEFFAACSGGACTVNLTFGAFFCISTVSILFVVCLCLYGEYSVRFVGRHAACTSPQATG